MAENKESFILYKDIIHMVSKLPMETQAGLFMHILNYVNDNNPVSDDILLITAFEPIKQQLKRDLKKWSETRQKRSEAGKIGGANSVQAKVSKAKQNKTSSSKSKQSQAKQAVPVLVTVNDTVINNISECALLNWLNEKCVKVQKMGKPITEEQALKIETEFNFAHTEQTFLAMENRKTLLKDYDSANLTFRAWIAKVDGAKKMTREEIAEFNRKAMGL